MKRTIVNIMSEQTTPNFLFTREKIRPGDELLFISSKKFEERIDWIEKSLGYNNCVSNRIIFDKSDTEERWQEMVSLLQDKIPDSKSYIVNLSGGTKYMILAVHFVFSKMKNVEFYYIPFPKNSILKIESNDVSPLQTRINIDEYLTSFNVSFQHKEITQKKEYTKKYFQYFVKGKLNFDLIDNLRCYRNSNKIDINKKETEAGTENKPQLTGLSNFLADMQFPLQNGGLLSKYEIQYITGGWFEEYIYNEIDEKIKPDDIKLGLNITRNRQVHNNDLDVVFTYENKLFVIECKTGIDGRWMFNETMYKATAIKNVLLGLSANTFIFSLSNDDTQLTETAKVMGIEYFGRSYFVNDNKFSNIIDSIKSKAK
jgi:hypothetical protein